MKYINRKNFGFQSASGRAWKLKESNGGSMKKQIAVSVVLTLFICTFLVFVSKSHAQAPAQTPPPAQGAAAAQKLEAIAKQLNLTPEQKVKLMPILKAEAPKVQAIKNNPSLGNLQKLEQIKALHNETAPQIQAILTPQQYEQLQGIRRQAFQQYMEKKRAQQSQ
jgi:Spy/CpxP family protein refolding chaperone